MCLPLKLLLLILQTVQITFGSSAARSGAKLKVFCDVIAFAPAVSLIKFKRLTKKKRRTQNAEPSSAELPAERAIFNFRVLHSIHAPKLGQHTHTHSRSSTLTYTPCQTLGLVFTVSWANPRHAFSRQNMRLRR